MFAALPTTRTAAMLRHDLAAAGIAYETDSGVLDFHALRAAYVSELVRSGAQVKTCQVLARHSDPKLTIGVYAKASIHDLTGAVESLPDLTNPARNRSRSAHGNRYADIPLSRSGSAGDAGDGSGHQESPLGGIAVPLLTDRMGWRNPLAVSGVTHPVARWREWAEPGSNRRHQDFQSCALPAELSAPSAR